ncbi:AMP dependent coa ligase [Nesidiocoris tenuis]|uniref:AMP dependent coa ligase n=1 Tax=Nesidiocoris tenuis TaxID=355587 RepID=A0ABN7B9Z8_9HEMI|nr:AMP dependent coa ligase [Nesidiocoris tenuis]
MKMFAVRTVLRSNSCLPQFSARHRSTCSHQQPEALRKLLRVLKQSQLRQRLSSSQWSSPNVVKSIYPDEPLPPGSFTDYLWSRMDGWKDETALVCGVSGRQMSYNEVRRQCRNFGASLRRELNLKTDDRLGVLLPNIMEYYPTAFGAMEAGIVPSPMNPIYKPDEVAHQLLDCEASAIVTLHQLLPTVQKAIEIAGLGKLKIIVVGNDTSTNGTIPFKDLIGNGDTSQLEDVRRCHDDMAIIPYSSGTTGRPKGVVLTHGNLTANLFGLDRGKDHIPRTATSKEVIPLILPLFHIYGLAIASLTILTGGEAVLLPKFEEETFVNSLKNATVLYVAPPLVIYLGNSPKVTGETLKSVRTVVSGAAPVGQADIDKVLKKMPGALYKQGYGLTETSPLVCTTPTTVYNPTSIGPPAVNTKVKVIDVETGQAAGPEESGEIVVKGPQVMKGYWKNQKATDEVLKDGWFYTGDIGHYDSKGYFYITDRVKELIKVKGFQVAPAELEAVLRGHPDVADAGVVGAPDPLKGEKPVAFIVLKANVQPNPETLKAYVVEKLAKYKRIEDFIFVESVPKSAAGKILRKELRLMVKERFPKA